jgi:hypothetical protein
MSITELDELQHPASDDGLWRESFYFNFHDASGKIAGMTTAGVRPNQNRVKGLAAIFLNPQQVLMHGVDCPLDAENAGLYSAGGISYEILTPLKKWRVRAEADFTSVDPCQTHQGDPSTQAIVPASFDFTFDALDPAYEFPPDVIEPLGGRARHYEQNGRIEGSVVVGSQEFAVNGFGARDHSWGIRDWLKADRWSMIFAQFGPRFTANVVLGAVQGQEVSIGYIFQGGINIPIKDAQFDVETDPVSGLSQEAQIEVTTVDGQSFSIQGSVNSIFPIFLSQGQGQVRWYECSTRFTCAQQTGYGMLEVVQTLHRDTSSQTTRLS